MPDDPKNRPESPAIERRRAIEGYFSKSGKVILTFLALALVVLFAAYGRQLFEILSGSGNHP